MALLDLSIKKEFGWHIIALGFIVYGKKLGVHKLYFSERNGYTKSFKVFGWRVFYKKL